LLRLFGWCVNAPETCSQLFDEHGEDPRSFAKNLGALRIKRKPFPSTATIVSKLFAGSAEDMEDAQGLSRTMSFPGAFPSDGDRNRPSSRGFRRL
jgi:hypothetical protein